MTSIIVGQRLHANTTDMTGFRFGRLTVLGFVGRSPTGVLMWSCRCDCGRERVVHANSLRSGHTSSCGCVRLDNVRSLTGKTFGRLTVVGVAASKPNGVYMNCRCECGEECVVRAWSLTSGTSKSCGCWRSPIFRRPPVTRTHGDSKTRLYRIWKHIRRRCLDPKDRYFYRYGGRGIKVCERWNTYEAFAGDMKALYLEHVAVHGEADTTIDRIDPDGSYEPSNCRWATRLEQSRNTAAAKRRRSEA